ncbi:MAG TPA: bifunctional methylenetetrahydrofolate dehydrogenase/methenyltetrahydrofolate cyclohydrolase FolD [Woeseiaceae bacterium]|nr:bifunctional methylenetetrahydrofolate dehydrogenase/methenyltetrahydrofolate cyclohydrolase FolD [Woeseiaceae bacterium]
MSRAVLIDGKAHAARLNDATGAEAIELLERHNVKPGLAVVLVGDDPASQVYVRNKTRTARDCGFHSVQHTLPADSREEDVLSLVRRLNDDPAIHGILVQLPLPAHLDERRITQAVAPWKDVDGFHFENVGKLTAGALDDALVPCTPAGCMLLIEDRLGRDLSGLRAVVIGRSNIVGKPMAALLLQANATVTICHSRTRDLPSVAREADVLVAAVGRPRMVGGDWIKPGATVIDVGINRVDEQVDGETQARLTGDVNFDEAVEVAGAITPVPGGVGPMTIAMLMANTLTAARRSLARS